MSNISVNISVEVDTTLPGQVRKLSIELTHLYSTNEVRQIIDKIFDSIYNHNTNVDQSIEIPIHPDYGKDKSDDNSAD